MAEAGIFLVIEKLDSFLIEKSNSTDDETRMMVEMVEMVRNELRQVMDFIADRKLEQGSRLKYWMYDMAEIAHNALRLIDIAISEGYYVLGMYFKSIFKEVTETRKSILQLGDEEANNSPLTYLSPWEGDEHVVGLEQDVESVIRESILCERRGLGATCIVGVTGIGKTTLARRIYNHAAVVDRYELRAWVCASDESSNKEVLMKLIQQVVHNEDQSVSLEDMEDADNESLRQMLHQHLQGKLFLIVLDNVGKVPYSKYNYEAFPKEDRESRLLVTSRFRSTIYRVKTHVDVSILEMKPLDDDRSWKMFLKLLLLANQEFPKQLERKGREMLRRCDGLPLSIEEVATQFVIKRQSGSEWEELLESIDLSATLAVLESVYNRWPPQLKSCFLCLSFFEKGTPIRSEKLVQVWTAGEVIPYEEELEDEEEKEVAARFRYWDRSVMNLTPTRSYVRDHVEGYKTTLMKLVDESIIEVDRRKNQSIKCIHVNASFHTLSVAKAEEEMVLETLKENGGNPPSSKEPRHRAIYCSRDKFNHFTNHDERLVSLFFRGGGYFESSEAYWKRFEQLRTLDFEGFGLKMLPETIGALTELRYLGLRDNYIQELPRTLGRLKNLETLDIALNFGMEVPDIIWKISSLRHLYMSDVICRKPLKIDALENLETLTYISVDNWTYEFSSLKMTSLCKLGIEEVDENSDISKLFASMANLRELNCLILRGFRFRSMPSLRGLETLDHLTEIRLDGRITKLPSADIFPFSISQLSLINSCLDEDPMPELGKLFKLLYLKLKNAYTGQQMVIPPKSFYRLEVLCVDELWHLRNIQVEDDTFRPVKLEIKSCPFLENIPENIITDKTKEVKMLTTRRLAAKIRKSDHLSQVEHVDIQP